MVDEAKAFCPACGNALVEEERRERVSSFDTMDNTVQLGQTMYNQMLSDMGLNISRTPDASEKRVEVLKPEPVAPISPAKPSTAQASSGNLKWILIGGAIVVIAMLVVLFAASVILYWPRSR